jgi:3-oxoadipate enol-lactonase
MDAATMTALACRVDGPADAPALVLLHAIATNGEMWSPQIGPWSARFRVLRPDLPGHGGSAPPAGPVSLADMAQAVRDTLDTHGIAQATVVGLSLGGMVAQAFALAHPERTRALVLAHTAARTEPAGHAIWQQRLQQARDEGVAAQVPATLARWLTPRFLGMAPLTCEWIAQQIRTTSQAGYEAAIAAIQTLDHLRSLRHISVPSLVVAGDADTAVPLAASERLVHGIAGARWLRLAGAPHLGNVECALEFTERVGAFLHETSARR